MTHTICFYHSVLVCDMYFREQIALLIAFILTTTPMAVDSNSSVDKASKDGITSEQGKIGTDTTEVNSCPLGCLSCSKWNGCLECAANFTWHMEKPFLRSIGVCLRDCPAGYFKREFQYAPGYYRCIECKTENCAVCGDQDFCDICESPYLEYRGSCILQCPKGLFHSKYRKDCYEQVDCLITPWTEWTVCARDGHTCGYKWGNQTRTRAVLQDPSTNGLKCPELEENRKCKLEKRFCNLDNTASKQEEIKKRKREQRLKEKRRRRCRLLRRAGIKCKRKDNSLDNIPINYYLPVAPGDTGDTNNLNYYRQSAELLKLLNIKKDKSDKQPKDKNKDKKSKNKSEEKT